MFKKGMKVVKIIRGPGDIASATVGWTVSKVNKKGGFVNISDESGDDGAYTYSTENGRELENFFPGMYSEIIPLE